MATSSGFWSYAHADNNAEGGRIVRLAQDVASQYEMITAESINLFLDRDHLEWGDEWEPKVNSALESGAFFMPVVTPRYFQSRECRREFSFFARKADQLGIRELVMPVLYVDFPALNENPCTDELVALARSFQWENWTELRFSARESPEYRRAVANLAARLSRAAASMEKIAIVEPQALVVDPEDDSPGFIEKLEMVERVLPEWNETVVEVSEKVEAIGALMQDATSEIEQGEARGKGFAARLTVARHLAAELEKPTAETQDLANKFAMQLTDIDPGVRVFLEHAPEEVRVNPESLTGLVDLMRALRVLIENSEYGLGKAEEMANAIAPVEQLSRNLRPVTRRLRKALMVMADCRDVMREWGSLLDRLPPPLDGISDR